MTGSPGSGGSGGSAGSGGAAGSAGAAGSPTVELELTVSPDKNRHAVSPLIYGVNGAASASKFPATLIRFGGNTSQAYNWEINATNGGRLAGYENEAAGESDEPGGAAMEVLKQAKAIGASAILTVPIGDYVAADTKPGNVMSSGSNYLSKRFDANRATKTSALSTTPDLTDGTVYQDEFANWAKGIAGTTKVMFALDNQPALWFEDHAEIHPAPTGYSEIVTRNISFAKAIRKVWPGVPILGYVGYGWQSFQNLQESPDAKSKGPFIEYYLEQMHAAEAVNNQRLIDYLDLHWWPEAKGAGVRVTEADAKPEVAAARVQAPRELWDPSYRETSWIQDVLGDDSIRLIPRMQQQIAAHYPGTKLSFSAWYFGGGGDISGAIATADVLGIFGREGVGAAAIDLPDGDDSYTIAGLSAYLDYDGKGSHFGDTSVSAVTNDSVGSSVYASSDSAKPEHLVIVTLNKGTRERATTLVLDSKTQYRTCQVYRLTERKPGFVPATALSATSDNSFSFEQPAMSVSVIVPKP